MKSPAKLVLVEDNPADVHLIRYAIEQTDPSIQLMHFEDGRTFLDYIDHHPDFRPGCLLLDLNMPMLTGHQVVKSLRANPSFNYLPIIIFTSSGNPVDVEQAYQLGANAYVRKPLEFEELVSILQSIADFWLRVNLLP